MPSLSADEVTNSWFPGAWKLDLIRRYVNGTEIEHPIWGTAPTGTIVYSPDGCMIVLITSTNPEHRPRGLMQLQDPSQQEAGYGKLAKHLLSYTGPWTVESVHAPGKEEEISKEHNISQPVKGVVVHGDLTTASLPDMVGGKQTRNFAFSDNGNSLTLSAEVAPGVEDEISWSRLSPRSR